MTSFQILYPVLHSLSKALWNYSESHQTSKVEYSGLFFVETHFIKKKKSHEQ